MLLAIIRQAAGCYLAITLAATGLAKLRLWRTASTGIIVLAALAASLVQAALAVAWAFSPAIGSPLLQLPVIVAFIIPFAAYAMSFYTRQPAITAG
jgi:hypothetical protein